nr:unnamed protein product [Digitaria exilis]
MPRMSWATVVAFLGAVTSPRRGGSPPPLARAVVTAMAGAAEDATKSRVCVSERGSRRRWRPSELREGGGAAAHGSSYVSPRILPA